MSKGTVESFPCPGTPNEDGGAVICCANGKTASKISELTCLPELFARCQELRERKDKRSGRGCRRTNDSRAVLELKQLTYNERVNDHYMQRPARPTRRFTTGDLQTPRRGEEIPKRLDEVLGLGE